MNLVVQLPLMNKLLSICDDEYTPDIDISFDLSFMQSSVFEYQWLFEGEQMFGQIHSCS